MFDTPWREDTAEEKQSKRICDMLGGDLEQAYKLEKAFALLLDSVTFEVGFDREDFMGSMVAAFQSMRSDLSQGAETLGALLGDVEQEENQAVKRSERFPDMIEDDARKLLIATGQKLASDESMKRLQQAQRYSGPAIAHHLAAEASHA